MAVSRSKDRPQWARDLVSRVISLWEDARKNGWTHEEILRRYEEIIHSPHWRQLTQYEHAEVFATYAACSAMAYRRDIVWRLGPASGPLSEDAQGKWGEGSELSRLCRIPGALYGAHFWRGTDKPFGEYKPTN